MDDLSFVDRLDEVMARRDHYAEVLQEGLRHKLKHIQNDGEHAVDYFRHLIRAGHDISDELREFAGYGHSIVLLAAMLAHEVNKQQESKQ